MESLSLENFRCYERLDIDFRPGINLLIGDNASGKTSLLRACKYALNSFFAGFNDENTNWASLNASDFRREVHGDWEAPEQPIRIYFTPSPAHYDALPEEMRHQPLFLAKNSTKNSRTLITGFKTFSAYAHALHNTYWETAPGSPGCQKRSLPLFASFTTEDIHSTRSLKPERFTKYTHKASFGYHACLNGHGLFPYWKKRLLALKEGNKGLIEQEIFHTAIRKALGEEGCHIISHTDIRPNRKNIYFTFTDGREIEDSLLPDGYMRLINIVTDLACRCALLNGALYGADSLSQTAGTVLVDEIDLHLHPSLQSLVLQGLRKAFPRLQFIITTHAPMVMSSIRNDEESAVWLLTHSRADGYHAKRVDTYGLDVSTITQDILSVIPRDRDVAKELDNLFHLISSHEYEQAQSRLLVLKEKYSDNISELTKASTMLNLISRTRR